jgi:hypothetical protein
VHHVQCDGLCPVLSEDIWTTGEDHTLNMEISRDPSYIQNVTTHRLLAMSEECSSSNSCEWVHVLKWLEFTTEILGLDEYHIRKDLLLLILEFAKTWSYFMLVVTPSTALNVDTVTFETQKVIVLKLVCTYVVI